MTAFYKTLDLPTYPTLLHDLSAIVDWDKFGQLCLNAPKGYEDNHQYGQGSLLYDWDNSFEQWDDVENRYRWIVPERLVPLQESDFTEPCIIFKGTVFEDILNVLRSHYTVGRVRIMKLAPKTCLTWHVDNSKRIHYPFKTNEGCKMIIEDSVFNLQEHNWYLTDTLRPHTAMNASKEPRLHIVACLLNDIPL